MKTRKSIRKAKSFSTNKTLSGKVNQLIKGTKLDSHPWPYLKTEQIDVVAKNEVKQEVPDVPKGFSKDLIFLQCENCKSSGYHQIDAAYRLVDVSKLTDFGTQTEPQIESVTVSHDIMEVVSNPGESDNIESFPRCDLSPPPAAPIIVLSSSEESKCLISTRVN